MVLEIQKYLRDPNNSIETLKKDFAFKVNRHNKYPNLHQIKYDQVNSPPTHPLTIECRGIILDADKNWNVVSLPFFRFFNYSQPGEAAIDWSTAEVQEKKDGSKLVLYFYNGEWEVGTSGMPDAAGKVHDLSDLSFRDLFWKTFKEQNLPLPPYKNCSWIFEMCTPLNRGVIKHQDSTLTLIGVRDLVTLQEIPAKNFAGLYSIVISYPFKNIEEVLEAAKKIDANKQEGFVVVDAQWNRIKVKSEDFVRLHHLKESLNFRRIVDVIKGNESQEVLTYFPEFRPAFEAVQKKFDTLVFDLESVFNQFNYIPDQKSFALRAVNSRMPDALFTVRRGQYKSMREYLANTRTDTILQVLGIKGVFKKEEE